MVLYYQERGGSAVKIITESDIAKLAGVSQTTVSRVIANDPRISKVTKKQVLEIARQLGYDMCPDNKSWSVGVILNFDTHDYFSSLHWAVAHEVLRRGLRLEIIADDALERVDSLPVRGLIDCRLTPTVQLPELAVPMVRINRESAHTDGVFSIILDEAKASATAVDFLLRSGHRNIRYVSFEGRQQEMEKLPRRWPGFVQALQKAGISDAEKYGIFFELDQEVTNTDVIAALSGAMRDGCTAIICVNSVDTLKINNAVHAMKLNIPDDLSIIDWEFYGVSANLDPPRTAMAIPFQRLASEALDMLTEIVQKKAYPADRRVDLELIVRRSVKDITAQV